MTKTLEVAPETKILIRARELIEEGWVQATAHHAGWDPNSALAGLPMLRHFYCVGGALEEARKTLGVGGGASDRAIAHLADAIGTGHIASWNDARSRKKKEVLGALDTAISRSMGIPRIP